MKVFNFFAHIFVIFAFLTLGSLLIIVALHILSVEDAVFKLREVYANPWQSIRTGFVGLFMITMGLAFARMLVKKGRDADALILQSEVGPILVSVDAIEDVVRKALKRFHLVKDGKIKTMIHGKDVEIKLRLVLWSSSKVQELLTEVQTEVSNRVRRLIRHESRLEVICDVQRIEDHEELTSAPTSQKVAIF